ncbi:DNA polymerase III subunit alpha [Christiangramia sp. SM2212]|uniref:DNA polymerase III subunit alpha n=1 Tax=Christiangramia sediminicola TaxID=3073267 RepID=A0ABU1EU77_9FLAO|nr:DNA polymerase III subunit alpha [Christiangramia sp. SM2212]MDR5591572.1 DNA polymerase III subunit alpha [Christiangramia sp. SM2212]
MFLNCHTYYSLRYGTMSTRELCQLAESNGVNQIALTDINNTSACLEFIKLNKNSDLNALVGIDFRNSADQQYVGIARNNQGYKQLNDHLSEHIHEKRNFENEAPLLPDCYIIYPFKKISITRKTDFRSNEFIGVSINDLRKLKFSEYRKLENKLVIFETVSFRNKKDFNAHRLLRAIDNNTLLSKLPESEQGSLSDKMIAEEILLKGFEEFPHIIKNTEKLFDSCKVDFEFGKGQNRNLLVLETPEKDRERLVDLCYQKLPERYSDPGKKVLDRVKKELNTIIKLGFVSYFLINLEIVNYARSKNYPFVGRGSGANSVVAYILGITNVDPIELDLYFERFINPNRSSPPDFDIDFSWKDRNDVTNFIFRNYRHTALMGTYVTFKSRAVARELGKVFGLPKENIDKLSQGFYDFKDLDHLEKLVLRYSRLIDGFPNYLSVHSGGILILNESVHNYAGTFLPPKGFQTIQIDMNIAEDVGIHKFDILAQRGLSKITDALEIIKQNQPNAKIEDIENIKLFKEDPAINDLLKVGDCMGVFYVESPAMRGLLTKLQTDNYMNLVAASSVIRPGVSSAGMKEEFIRRHRDPEKKKEAHPVMLEIMEDTYGVMVYQEDVMKVAHIFAGLDLDDADVLRRGMSGKKTSKGQMEKIEHNYRENCAQRGYPLKLTNEVWEQISSFAGYAFPKGHSASYAVESYQSLYLKKYFPLEFMVAAINNGGGFYNLQTYIQEIRNCGGKIHAPCINRSDHPNTIFGKDIYLGFGYIKELENKTIQQILENRQFFGQFRSLDDFIDRIDISIEQISLLLKINAFRFTGLDKHELLWNAYFKLNKSRPKSNQALLFKPQHREFELPEFEFSKIIEAYDQMQLLGFPLCNHFDLLAEPMHNTLTAKKLKHHISKNVEIYGNLVDYRKTGTSNGKYMYFATFYDILGDIFDVVLFPNAAEKYPIRSDGIYKCSGKVMCDLGYVSIEINWISRLTTQTDPRLVGSNFKISLK